VSERKVEICQDIYATHAPIFQLTITILEISTATTKVSDAGRDFVGIPATGRKPISEDRSSHRGAEGGSEELIIPAKPEQK
jgi:hypothetical protein